MLQANVSRLRCLAHLLLELAAVSCCQALQRGSCVPLQCCSMRLVHTTSDVRDQLDCGSISSVGSLVGADGGEWPAC